MHRIGLNWPITQTSMDKQEIQYELKRLKMKGMNSQVWQKVALSELKRQIQVYLNRYIEVACPLCLKRYDVFSNPPIIVCVGQHKCCKECSQIEGAFMSLGVKDQLGAELKQVKNQPQLKSCFAPNCKQLILKANFLKDHQTIFYLTQKTKPLRKPNQTFAQSSSITNLTRQLSQLNLYDSQLQTQLLYINKYLLPRLKYKQSSIMNAKSLIEKNIRQVKKQLQQMQRQEAEAEMNQIEPSQLEEDEIKELLSMNYSITLINDLEHKINDAKTAQVKQQNCQIVQYAFGQNINQIKQNLPKFIPKNIIILPYQTEKILSSNLEDKQLEAPLHIYVDVEPQQQGNIKQMDMKKDQQMYAYIQQSIVRLIKRTKNLWKFLRIQKQIAQFSEQQFIQIMCMELKKIEQFSVTQIYKFQGYQTFKDLLNYLLKQYTNNLYTIINQIMSSTDPITIARMRYFIHLMLVNYQQHIVGDIPSVSNEYYRYTKISKLQFRTYSVGGFIFFTTLTSCSYEGQPQFSHAPNQTEIRVKYTIKTMSEDLTNSEASPFNPYLDITGMSKYSHQKEVLFFPYQIFLIQDIQYFEEVKLAEVQLKEVPKKYIIEEIQKPQNDLLQTIMDHGNPQNPGKILQALSSAKTQMKAKMQEFVSRKKEQIEKKNDKRQEEVKQNFKQLIEYSQTHSIVQLKKKLMKCQSLDQISYLNLSSCGIHKIEFMHYFRKLKVLSLWDNLIEKIEGLENNRELRKLLLGKNHIHSLKNVESVAGILEELSLYDNKLDLTAAKYLKDKVKVFPQISTFSISFNSLSIADNSQSYKAIFDLDSLNNQLASMKLSTQRQISFGLFPKLNIIQIYNSQKISEQTKDFAKKVISDMNRVNSDLHKKRLVVMSPGKKQDTQHKKYETQKRPKRISIPKSPKKTISHKQKSAQSPKYHTQSIPSSKQSFNSILIFWYE